MTITCFKPSGTQGLVTSFLRGKIYYPLIIYTYTGARNKLFERKDILSFDNIHVHRG